jgi:hypothetical protein
MDNFIEEMENNISLSTQSIDDILNSLAKIEGNLISVGTGGSRVVAEYAASVLAKKNHIMTKCVDPSDLNYLDKSFYKNIFISSYSGSNFGVKKSLLENLKKYLLTNRKTKISDEAILHYEMPYEDSFISLNATIVPMAILLKYYLGENFYKVIEEIFHKIDKNIFLNIYSEFVNVYYGIDTPATKSFIESTFVEAGIAGVVLHEKYSYCHGRSTLNKNKSHSAIYIRNKNTDLDNTIKEVMNFQMKDYCLLESLFSDEIVDDFYLTLQSIYLLRNIAKSKNIDLSKIDYDKEATRKLYYFKGSM